MKKTRRNRQCRLAYKNWEVEAGTVKYSKHPANTVYFRSRDINPKTKKKRVEIDWELTDDEALAIAHVITHAVWYSIHRQRGTRVFGK